MAEIESSEVLSDSENLERLKKHTKFFKRCLDILPSYCQSLDTSRWARGSQSLTAASSFLFCSRMTLLFFCLSGLDVLDAVDFQTERKSEIIDWIYAQQILPDSGIVLSNCCL